jgi:arylesterase/paraoxonase
MKTLKILAFIFLVIIIYILYTFVSTGFFREINNSSDFLITKYELPGVEDMEISYEDQFIILSSDNRKSRRNGQPVQGGLFYFDLNDPDKSPYLLSESFSSTLYPHGISLKKIGKGKYRLWVVNHPEGRHTIEVFDLEKSNLIHVNTLTDEMLISPNDIVAIDSVRFYVTNDHGFDSKLGLLAENYLGLSVSDVVYFDGRQFTQAAKGIAYANGIAFDASRSILYVASPRTFSVKVYGLEEGGKLNHHTDIYTGSGVDNLVIDPNGDIWSGAHPNLLQFTSYAQGNSKKAPSEVIKINLIKDNQYKVRSIYVDDGSTVSASSVALPFQDKIFVGNVMDEYFVQLQKK